MKDSKKGYTLVEIIVCFALIGVFMSAVAVVLPMYIEVTMKINSINHSQTLAVTLMDTITGELEAAANNNIEKTSNTAMQIEDGKEVTFYDRNNYLVEMKVDENNKHLSLLYHDKQQGGGSEIVDWGYGSDVYMDNEISKLSFEKVEGNNLLKVVLRLVNIRTGYEYEKKAMIQCRNLTEANIQVVDGGE